MRCTLIIAFGNLLLIIFINEVSYPSTRNISHSLKEFERLLPSCVYCHFCLCELVCVCVVFGALLYMVFSFKPVNISIDFQVSNLLYFMFGVLLLSGNTDEFCSLRKPASVSPWPKYSSCLRISSFRANLQFPAWVSEVSQVAHLASWNTYVILIQININKDLSSTLQNWNH